jgi:hypothetical protein
MPASTGTTRNSRGAQIINKRGTVYNTKHTSIQIIHYQYNKNTIQHKYFIIKKLFTTLQRNTHTIHTVEFQPALTGPDHHVVVQQS